jgi:dCMP deaminase
MAERGTCPYIKVGAIVARDGRILTSGYNGAPAGMEHCTHGDRNSDLPIAPCTTAIHAEANAIAYAARHGAPLHDATMYTTLSPCRTCAQLIIQSGISRVVCMEMYRDPVGVELLRAASIAVSL